MKHLRLYKEIVKKPQVGDYVYVKDNNPNIQSYLNNNIGIIISYQQLKSVNYPYMVRFFDIPINIQEWFRYPSKCREFSIGEIIYFSDNKKDVEAYIQATKFNL